MTLNNAVQFAAVFRPLDYTTLSTIALAKDRLTLSEVTVNFDASVEFRRGG